MYVALKGSGVQKKGSMATRSNRRSPMLGRESQRYVCRGSYRASSSPVFVRLELRRLRFSGKKDCDPQGIALRQYQAVKIQYSALMRAAKHSNTRDLITYYIFMYH